MASRFVLPNADVGNGIAPSDGAQLFFFATGTSTPKATFKDAAGATPNSNPVIADSDGVFPDIFISGTYKVQLKDKNGVGVGFVETDPVDEFSLESSVTAAVPLNDKRYAPKFATIAAMVAASPVALDGLVVVPAVGMIIAIDDYATGNNSGLLFGLVVTGGTGTADGGSFIDLDNGLQWRQNFPSQITTKMFGARLDGVQDVTAATQAAFTYAESTGNNELVLLPAGRHLITDTINTYEGAKFEGQNIDYGGIAGATSFPDQLSDARGTVIIFNPSSQKSLFVPALPKGGSAAWSGIGIRNMSIWGNSSMDDYHRGIFGDTDPVVTDSLYAIDFKEVQFSNVENVAIMGFVSGVREADRSQGNTFNRVNIQRCREASILYGEITTGVAATSSVWNQCVLRICLMVVEEQEAVNQANNLQPRFTDCYFEDMASYGFRLGKSIQNWTLTNCYAEAVPSDTGVADRAMFSVGKFGVGTVNPTVGLNVIGGQYAGFSTGVFLDIDASNGVNLIGCEAKRYTTVFNPTANTRDRSIFMAGFTYNATATFNGGTAGKFVGTYKTTGLDNPSTTVLIDNEFIGNAVSGSTLNLLGGIIRLGDGSSTSANPGADNTQNLGTGALRWKEVFAVAPAINTSDARSKQQDRPLNEAEKAVAVKAKALLKTYKFNHAVEDKGDGARIHVGIYVQELIAAFESEGLDAFDYALVCYDEWPERTDKDIAEDGTVTEVVTPAGNSYGVRYSELLAFIIAAI
jgi:hypothetical protein